MALAIHHNKSAGIHLQVLNSYDLNGDVKYDESSLCTSCKIKTKSFLSKVSNNGLFVVFQPIPSVTQIRTIPCPFKKSYKPLYSPAVALSLEPPPP